MSKSIRLSRKHGLNPTIPACFWCGGDKNEIALLGASYKGEAPMHMVMDYEPCDKCRETFSQGILFFEARPAQTQLEQDRALGEGMIPTGRYVIMTEEGAANALKSPMRESVLKARKCMVSSEDFDNLFGDAIQQMKDNEK